MGLGDALAAPVPSPTRQDELTVSAVHTGSTRRKRRLYPEGPIVVPGSPAHSGVQVCSSMEVILIPDFVGPVLTCKLHFHCHLNFV